MILVNALVALHSGGVAAVGHRGGVQCGHLSAVVVVHLIGAVDGLVVSQRDRGDRHITLL